MELTKTQKQVLKVLIDNPNVWLTGIQIRDKENMNYAHVKAVLKKFMKLDYVFFNGNESFQISPEGESAYINSI